MRRAVTTDRVVPTRFAHYVLRSRDMAASVQWYETVLGMEIVHQNPALTFLTYDDEHHRLALVQIDCDGQPVDKRLPGLDHVAYTLADLGALLGQYKRLKAHDILPVWPINHGLTTSLYYEDPDGNRVEFQVENFHTSDELNAYIRSDAFARNPIGVEFDPETLLARYEDGEPLAELLRQQAD